MSAEILVIVSFGAFFAALFYSVYEFGFKDKGLSHS